ncbi:MAG: hypothetical protein R3E73_09710 [Porticoccaceae bacterium]
MRHPDLIRLEPEGNAIKIAQIRTVGNFMAKTAQQGGWKVVLIEPVEAMQNVRFGRKCPAENLEEPGDKTLLILVSHQLGRIPQRSAAVVAYWKFHCRRRILLLPGCVR